MTNKIQFSDLIEDATKLGTDAGKGKDTQVKLIYSAAQGGFHNAADITKHKHGQDIDDAVKMAEAYYKAQSGSSIFNSKAPNQAKLASIVRTGIRIGAWPKGGNGEPMATIDTLLDMWRTLRKVPQEAKRLEDATECLLRYARAQLKLDELIPEERLKQFCYKKGQSLATPEEILAGMVKSLDKLITGAAAQGTALDNSQEVKDARHQLRQRLAAIAKARSTPTPTVP